MATAQDSVNKLRVLLQEVDPTNSRWDDTLHLLPYVNLGRREWSVESKANKALFEQTTAVGKTPGSRYASYILDPGILKIDNVYWDDIEVEEVGLGEWDEWIGGDTDGLGRPEIYRRVGDSIDLWPACSEAKTLAIYASVLTTDLPDLTAIENELNEHKTWGALFFAAAQALTDDSRDGSIYLAKGMKNALEYKKAVAASGPRFTERTEARHWRM